jgi:protein TonB
MNLADRPFPQDPFHAQRRAGGAMASGAVHLVTVLSLIAIFRAIPENARSEATRALVPDIVWLPHDNAGGGRDGGGDLSAAAPRRIREVGRTQVSTPQATALSDDIARQEPEETTTIPAKPTGDAPSPFVGVVESNGVSLGPGQTGVGTSAGNDSGGIGSQPGPGFGAGASRPGGPGVTTPTLIHQVKPRYTADAMRLRIQGSVLVECVVLPDGLVGDARVVRSLDSRFGLDDEAIAAAKQWRFRPGTLNGKPVPVVVSIELMFSVR